MRQASTTFGASLTPDAHERRSSPPYKPQVKASTGHASASDAASTATPVAEVPARTSATAILRLRTLKRRPSDAETSAPSDSVRGVRSVSAELSDDISVNRAGSGMCPWCGSGAAMRDPSRGTGQPSGSCPRQCCLPRCRPCSLAAPCLFPPVVRISRIRVPRHIVEAGSGPVTRICVQGEADAVALSLLTTTRGAALAAPQGASDVRPRLLGLLAGTAAHDQPGGQQCDPSEEDRDRREARERELLVPAGALGAGFDLAGGLDAAGVLLGPGWAAVVLLAARGATGLLLAEDALVVVVVLRTVLARRRVVLLAREAAHREGSPAGAQHHAEDQHGDDRQS